MPVTLGFSPVDLLVLLARDSGFLVTLHNQGGNWAPGISIKLNFTPDPVLGQGPPIAITWMADLAGDDANFDEAVDAVRAVLDAEALNVRLIYVDDSGHPLLWGRGRVEEV